MIDQARLIRVLQHTAVALAGFLLAWLIVAFAVFPTRGGSDAVTVPPVTGLSVDSAGRRLADAGLRNSLGETRSGGSAPESTVVAQTPAAGTRAAPGDTVTLDVSGGAKQLAVPSVIGLAQSDAGTTLRAAGLVPGSEKEESSDQPRGTVLATRPDAGEVVAAGAAIALTVSAGPAQLTMPRVTGRDVLEARATIEQLGLTLSPLEYDSTSTLAAGAVVAQSPAAGTAVAQGLSVTLRVAGKP